MFQDSMSTIFLVFGMWLLPPVLMIGSPASGSNCPALNGLEAGRSGVVNSFT